MSDTSCSFCNNSEHTVVANPEHTKFICKLCIIQAAHTIENFPKGKVVTLKGKLK